MKTGSPPTRRLAVLLITIIAWSTSLADEVNFNRDIRPILADKCFACHGPDAKALQGGLRLDLYSSVTSPADSGRTAIVTGQPSQSELILRITSDDTDQIMPPPESHKSLEETEKKLLKSWIANGAEYKEHWSFLSPQRTAPPESPLLSEPVWSDQAIDRFVLAEMQRRGLTPSTEADPLTLIRRVSLDLLGLPPTIAEIDAYASDQSEEAYEKMVDRILASPRFGERMAMTWLDLARYGDTNGYHADSDRPVWLWRDWVIEAYNNNMPFDQFSIWQLAGDLLPDSTVEQKIASGFNRNVRFNEEGGADPAEFLTAYAADRTITMGRIWLGLTLNCAQCHSHKYDPISQEEFYELTAFFNSLEEEGAGGVTGFHGKPVPPVMRVQTRALREELATTIERLSKIEAELTQIMASVDLSDPGFSGDPKSHVDTSRLAWEASIVAYQPPPAPTPTARWNFVGGVEDTVGQLDGTMKDGAISNSEGLLLDGKTAHVVTAPIGAELRARTFEAWVKLNNLSQAGGAVMGVQTLDEDHSTMTFDAIVFGEQKPGRWMAGSDSFKRTQSFGGEPETTADKEFVHIAIAYDEDGTIRGYRNGRPYGQPYKKELQVYAAGEARLVFGARALPSGSNFMLDGIIREARLYDRALSESEIAASAGVSSLGVPDAVLAAIQTPREQRSKEQEELLHDYYFRNVHAATKERLKRPQEEAHSLRERIAFLQSEQNWPLQMVSVELPQPRPAFVLTRGDFQMPGEAVTRDVPAFLPPMKDELPRDRLGLARWLMQQDQPLVARVQVNRLWQMLFGEGLVRTMGDFGLQGEFPTHSELLDWLALDYIESGWDTKRMLKKILLSRTYRQSSLDTRRFAEVDPQNKYLWRAPRVRLQAEVIRDNALAAAGLLSDKMGGPPVFPHQPSGFYNGKNNGWQWNASQGEDRYRRGLYTFWRRTTPYPTFVIFDAPDRAECTFERPRTNTPLQALATLNDLQFVDAARALARRLIAEAEGTDARITLAYRLCMSRAPLPDELSLLRAFVSEQTELYRAQGDAAKALVEHDSAGTVGELEVAEYAAWTTTANVLLNLDEVITRN
jgi:Protein of unknown function (DUF1553)/Protein of unknown function (DUF1549)/Planctomycete cytochrome C/Concanavalin A-like lectin/glucanases superfamily